MRLFHKTPQLFSFDAHWPKWLHSLYSENVFIVLFYLHNVLLFVIILNGWWAFHYSMFPCPYYVSLVLFLWTRIFIGLLAWSGMVSILWQISFAWIYYEKHKEWSRFLVRECSWNGIFRMRVAVITFCGQLVSYLVHYNTFTKSQATIDTFRKRPKTLELAHGSE